MTAGEDLYSGCGYEANEESLNPCLGQREPAELSRPKSLGKLVGLQSEALKSRLKFVAVPLASWSGYCGYVRVTLLSLLCTV